MENPVYRTIDTTEYSDLQDRILYEDNHFLIFNKKSGEITQGDKTGDEPLSETLKAFIAHRDGKKGNVFLGVAHRIDRPVSGAVIFAKTSKGLSRINELIRDGKIVKKYSALLCSKPPKESDELIDYLWRNEKNNKTYVTKREPIGSSESVNSYKPAPKGYKEARLKYTFIRPTKNYFLTEIELLTGRHHQIRAQMSGIGCPIKGDLKYGAPRSNRNGSISLHSHVIEFEHPVKKIRIRVEAPLPEDSFYGV